MKASNRFVKALSVVVLVLAVGVLAAPTTAASVADPLTPTLQYPSPTLCQVDSPNPGEMNTLAAVTSIPIPLGQGETMMWAVGSTRPMLGTGGQINTLVMVNKGGVWTTMASPSYAGANYLTAISGTTDKDVWAVGYFVRYGREYPIVMHYDGIVWKFALYPDPTFGKSMSMPGIGGIRLTGVAALTTKDVVAVGYRTTDYHGYRPYVLYYNGTYWKEMAFPTTAGSVRILGVAGRSIDDLWAIATMGEDNVAGTMSMLYRYGAGTWTLTTKLEGNFHSLAVAPDRVFAVGHADVASKEESLALMYDKMKGETMRVKTFNKFVDNNYLLSVTAAGDNVYAVGYSGHLDSGKGVTPLVVKYDGATFVPVEAFTPTPMTRLLGVTLDHGNVWAVGDYAKESYPGALLDASNTLIETTSCLVDR